jgi:hypothetical protein
MSDCGEGPNPDDVEDLFPSGSTPENRTERANPLCSYGLRPFVLGGFLQTLLQQHFCDVANLAEMQLRTKFEAAAWNPSLDTGLVIDQLTKWDPEKTEKRPAILLKRGRWAYQRLAIGDAGEANAVTGAEHFVGMWQGSHTLFVLAGKAGEAEQLGAEVAVTLLRYGRTIQNYVGLHRFIPVEIGEVRAVEESKKNYAVPVTFAYAAEEAWEMYEHAPRLKRIVFRPHDFLG